MLCGFMLKADHFSVFIEKHLSGTIGNRIYSSIFLEGVFFGANLSVGYSLHKKLSTMALLGV